MAKLVGSSALVTGGASGIGAAICRALADEGSTVVIADIDAAGGRALAAQVRGASFQPMDVTRGDSVAAAAAEIFARTGEVDILVNCAGGATPKAFFETDESQWVDLIQLNLLGVMRCSHLFTPPMTSRGRGRVINISSGAGMRGQALQAAYSAAKGGVNAFTKVLSKEVASSGVTVNAVCPGATETPPLRAYRETPEGSAFVAKLEAGIPLGRLAQPTDIAAAVVFFASELAGHITGEILSVNGGFG